MLPLVHQLKFSQMAGLLGYTCSVISSYFFHSQRPVLCWTDPFLSHKRLHECDLVGKDLLIIGDVHGCYDELMKLLKEAEMLTSKHVVKVFVGDMINKGPKNEEMLSYIMSTENVHCVRGNHEQKILKEYNEYKQGESEACESRLWIKNMAPSEIDFLRSLPYTISIPWLNIIVVHAGFVPGISIYMQNKNDMLNMRNLFWAKDDFHGKVLQATYRKDIGHRWSDQWQGPEHVYFGHDAIRKLQCYTSVNLQEHEELLGLVEFG